MSSKSHASNSNSSNATTDILRSEVSSQQQGISSEHAHHMTTTTTTTTTTANMQSQSSSFSSSSASDPLYQSSFSSVANLTTSNVRLLSSFQDGHHHTPHQSSSTSEHQHQSNLAESNDFESLSTSGEWSIISEGSAVHNNTLQQQQRGHDDNDDLLHNQEAEDGGLFRSTATFSLTSSIFSLPPDAEDSVHSPISSSSSYGSSVPSPVRNHADAEDSANPAHPHSNTVTNQSSHHHQSEIMNHPPGVSEISSENGVPLQIDISAKSNSNSDSQSSTSSIPRSNSSPLIYNPNDKLLRSLVTEKISFELPPEYLISQGSAFSQIHSPHNVVFNPHSQNTILEHAVISREDWKVNIFVQNITSWTGVEEFTYARFFNNSIPKMRKTYKFRELYPAVVVQVVQPDKSSVLTFSIMLCHSLIITFQTKVKTPAQWDEAHFVVDALQVDEPFPASGKLKISASLNDGSGNSVEMDVPSVFCTTYEEGVTPSPKKYTESLYTAKNRIFEVFAPLVVGTVKPALSPCGFALYSVYSEDVHSFIAKYRNEHAPAPEKIDQNLKANDILCRFFQYKSDNHTFLDCIFQHPDVRRKVFILSIYVDYGVMSQQRKAYMISILDCIESIRFTTSFMKGVPATFLYKSEAYKFSMLVPSDSLVVENPVPFPLDCIVSVTSQVVFSPVSLKRKISALCTTLISKCNREVPEEEDPDPEQLAKFKRKQLLLNSIYKESDVECSLLNDEWMTRFTVQEPNKFVVGTYVFYNASEIYLFKTEVYGCPSDIIRRQVICFHNTIQFAE
eukprot:CAMPEP_0117451078 /NCGR_PEP_ID=MMETSP0759-20121206/8812_1 /TAXON_ID=63605 /ORGANISM="Percolomonas cosmopolitus, Strain WS" /LENGTH=789 /DNA_ID=CAMNT_0005243647 /DNA_START=322 /DNA_END=2691 /DNA_ORIENTATION=-